MGDNSIEMEVLELALWHRRLIYSFLHDTGTRSSKILTWLHSIDPVRDQLVEHLLGK